DIKEVSASGTGVAFVNGGSPGPTLKTLVLTRPFAKITASVMATASETGIREIHFKGVRINPKLAGPNGVPGVFAPIYTAAMGQMLLTHTLPAAGTIGLCNASGCGASVAVKLTRTKGGKAVGPGVGGTIMATGMSGTKTGLTKLTVNGTPWTVNKTAVKYQTKKGGTATFMSTGAVHGPLGKAGSTFSLTSHGMGGTLQLVTGIRT